MLCKNYVHISNLPNAINLLIVMTTCRMDKHMSIGQFTHQDVRTVLSRITHQLIALTPLCLGRSDG